MKNYLLQISSIFLFFVSATLNILGYINLFPKSIYMAGSVLAGLELAKFTIVGVVYNTTSVSKKLKALLTIFLTLLILISVIGHYAMLTSFYSQNKLTSSIIADNTIFLENRVKEVNSNITELQSLYQEFPEGYASKKMKVYNEVKPQIDALQLEYKSLIDELNTERLAKLKEKKDNANVFEASAELMDVSSDTFAFYIIMGLSIILDPLALLMVFTAHSFSSKKEDAKSSLEEERDLAIKELEEFKSNEKYNKLVTYLTDMKNSSLFNKTVRDVMIFDEVMLAEFKKSLLTKKDREWFKMALIWRKFGKVGPTDISMDFNKVRNTSINEIYGDV